MNVTRLGPYTLGRQLGRGGMGTVFEGHNEENGERVAIKILSQSLAMDEGFRERFSQEIETLRRLNHENIVRLLGFGEQDGTLFYSMELVEGSSLEQEIRKGRRFDWQEATQIGVQMCRGLKHAHDRGVIHRDIKPANLMITPEGQIKISDFGIAKLFGASGITMAGGVIGTAEFMAPEQADGRPVTHRSDLYSLGGVMYALIAGRPPFVSKSIVDVLQMQRFSKPEPLRRHDPDVPREFDDIVLQLLAKDPQERISNATVLMRRLEATERGLTRKIEQQGEDHDFELTPQAANPPVLDPGATSQVDVTRVATTSRKKGDSVDLLAPTRQTGGMDVAATQASVASSGEMAEPAASATHFTTVKDGERGDTLLSEDEPTRNWPQIVLLTAGLLGIIAVVWYFMQPPSADEIYSQIETVAGDGPDAYPRVEAQIAEFLERFPNDSRAAVVQGYQDELNLHEETRGYRTKLRQKSVDELAPFERMFLQATDRQLTPADRAARLRSLLALLATATAEERKELDACLEMTRSELAAIEKAATEQRGAEGRFLASRLAAARTLPQAEAREILTGIIMFYGNSDWAKDYVQQARDQLQALPVGDGVSSGTGSN